jgi:hypothetical protein
VSKQRGVGTLGCRNNSVSEHWGVRIAGCIFNYSLLGSDMMLNYDITPSCLSILI